MITYLTCLTNTTTEIKIIVNFYLFQNYLRWCVYKRTNFYNVVDQQSNTNAMISNDRNLIE